MCRNSAKRGEARGARHSKAETRRYLPRLCESLARASYSSISLLRKTISDHFFLEVLEFHLSGACIGRTLEVLREFPQLAVDEDCTYPAAPFSA